ncbi:MAG: PAS domain-containing protein [Bacteroidota bacterium]
MNQITLGKSFLDWHRIAVHPEFLYDLLILGQIIAFPFEMQTLMIEILNNPWVSGIAGGTISSIIAFFITRNYILNKERLKGKHLYQYPAFYPIKTNLENEIEIDRDTLLESLIYFTQKRKDRLSAFELFSLIDSCRLSKDFNEFENKAYLNFLRKYSRERLKKWNSEYHELLRPYQEIVNSLGDTFNGLEIEFVLHRAINPIKSIIALKNTVFKRDLNGANTSFGLTLIKDYGMIQDKTNRRKSEVSYEVTLGDKKVKSTTIPIFDDKYGLLGFLCLNIPIHEDKYTGNIPVKTFFQSFFRVNENKRINEVILKSKISKTE